MKRKLKTWIFIIVLSLLLMRPIYQMYLNKEYSLKPLSSEELITLESETDDYWVVFGRPTCDECKVFLPKLEKVSKMNKVSVYYYNTDTERKNDETEMMKLLAKYEVVAVPTLLHIKSDAVAKKWIGDQSLQSIKDLLY